MQPSSWHYQLRRMLIGVFTFLLITLFLPAQDIELPYYESDAVVIRYAGFALKYNEEYEQAEWVAYQLTDDEVQGTIERTNNFRADQNITTGSAALADYKGSGYDRGHLAPAADMRWSHNAMSDSFFMSNMSPQLPGFNRGVWKSSRI